MSDAGGEFIFQTSCLSFTSHSTPVLVLDPQTIFQAQEREKSDVALSVTTVGLNQHPFLFLYSEKGGGKQGARGVAGPLQARTSAGTERAAQDESGLCFFLLNDSHAEANWSEMHKLFSAFLELPVELVIFVFVFLFYFSLPGNMISVFSTLSGFPHPI